MSLNWDIHKCANWQELVNDENSTVTDTIVWASLSVGLSRITADNIDKWYTRINMVEKMRGAYLFVSEDGKRRARYITIDDLQRRIGLFTNVANITDAQFRMSIWRAHERDCKYDCTKWRSNKEVEHV